MQVHVFQAYPFLDCAKRAFSSIHSFVKHTLPQIQSRSPRSMPSFAEAELGKELGGNPIIVSGDGSEMPTCQDRLDEFTTTTIGNSPASSDSEQEVTPSWMHSPVWPTQKEAIFKGKNLLEVEMHEHSTSNPLDDIPNLCLPPSHTTPIYAQATKGQTLPRMRPRRVSGNERGPPPKSWLPNSLPRSSTLLSMSPISISSPPKPRLRLAANASYPDLVSLLEGRSSIAPANEPRMSSSPAMT